MWVLRGKKEKKKSKCYIVYLLCTPGPFIECKCSFIVKFFSSSKLSYTYLYLAPSINRQDWSFDKSPENYLDTIYKDNLIAIHLGKLESPLSILAAREQNWSLKEGIVQCQGWNYFEFLRANEILGEKLG